MSAPRCRQSSFTHLDLERPDFRTAQQGWTSRSWTLWQPAERKRRISQAGLPDAVGEASFSWLCTLCSLVEVIKITLAQQESQSNNNDKNTTKREEIAE